MLLHLNAGFGQSLGREALLTIKGRGYAGIRQDIPSGETTEPLIREIVEAGVHPILLVAGGKMGLGPGTPPHDIAVLAEHVARIAQQLGLLDREPAPAIEIGNEPDIAHTYSKRPDLFAEAVRLSRDRIRAVSDRFQIITGGIKDTGRKCIDYLAAAARSGLPEDCIIGYHTYRTTQQPEDALEGFSTREEEFAALKQVAAGRSIWCTETGWHTAPSEVRYGPFQLRKRRVQFTDEQVADFAEREVKINAAQGALGLVWFQLNDGPDPNAYEHRFGIRAQDGRWKPVADRLASLGPNVA